MAIRCVVLDFDGTFTDVAQEAEPFEQTYRADLGDLLGRNIERLWSAEAAEILSRPSAFGWEFGGKVVAPATADPYLLATAVAQRIFDRLDLLRNPALRTEVSQAIYRDAYGHTRDAFKPEAREVLEALLARPGLSVTVVTNSNPDVVNRKLDKLAPRGREHLRVIGDARKFVVDEPLPVDEVFAGVPEAQRLAALPQRPVLLRRGRYYEVLRRLWAELDATPETTLVCGDIYELDLALPAALGCSVHLVKRPNALEYELEAMRELGARGGVSESLRELLTRV